MPGRKPTLYMSSLDEVKTGEATDIYFKRTKHIIEEAGLSDLKVRMEVHAYSMPKGYEWAVLAGLEEALAILEGRDVTVYSIPEGTIFYKKEPVMVIEGRYSDFADLETSILGVLRFSSSIATATARMKKLAGEKSILFFGLRALHPAVYPAADRAAYIGGADGVSGVLAKKYLGIEPKGTMPHALIIAFGDQRKAWKWFADLYSGETPVIALIDTFDDERVEARLAVETLGDRLWGVRLDTPSSRRGKMREIVEEVKWILKLEGYPNVKIIVSGGIGESQIVELRDVVDGFGVGTSIAAAPSVDLSMDIVEVDRGNGWEKISKRGKLPGAKKIVRCNGERLTVFLDETPECRGGYEEVTVKYIEDGKLIRSLPSLDEIRSYVLKQLEEVQL
ncbi:MAG: nicotinate phosphoribosyltransferase [Desulfurococcales archaeon]|nr:nicotinate phosphoribosyltransferase [Desulfurococcales archaeon]